MDDFRKRLNTTCDYGMSDETMDMFIGLMSEINLKDKEPLIPYGKFDNNIYVLREGILRKAYFDGMREKTMAFATPGNLIISYHSFYMHVPSFFQYESCGRSVVMKIPKAKFDELSEQSVDFKNWMLRMCVEQLWCWEMKASVINGTAKERFEALIKNRPEILKRVSNKIIASYIGVNQPYLSRLKRHILSGSE